MIKSSMGKLDLTSTALSHSH